VASYAPRPRIRSAWRARCSVPETRGSLRLVPPHTPRKPAAAKRQSRSPKTGRTETRHEVPPNLGANAKLKTWLAAFLLGGLCLAAVTLVVGPSESKSSSEPRVGERRGDLGASRTVTGKYDRGFGWEQVELEIKLVSVRSKKEADESVQRTATRTGRSITGRFRVRNRSAHPIDEYPELVAVDRFARQSHGAPGQTSRTPSLEHLRVAPRGRSEGYFSVEVPAERRIERLELRLFGESLEWRLDRPV
jgi:hypothetical protein